MIDGQRPHGEYRPTDRPGLDAVPPTWMSIRFSHKRDDEYFTADGRRNGQFVRA